MKKKVQRNRIIAGIISIAIVISMLVGTVATAFADEIKIVTLGADLSDEQRQLITNYFNIDENNVEVVTVNNDDEHNYLDGIATPQQIGKHTYSCTYIEPTNEGGIHIKTVNLTWVTCEMIRNALITSGISNCNVICAAPIEVSGTGALTGIFKAYESMGNEKLDDAKVDLASQELVETMEISKDIGQDEATSLIGDIKESVIVGGLSSEAEISNKIEEYLKENDIKLTEEQQDALIKLMLDISKQNYSVDDVKNAYQDVKDTVQNIKETSEEAMNILEKIVNWLQTTWQKITGKYDEIQKTEEAQAIKEQLGILADTNDSLLGSDTVVTITEDADTVSKADSVEEDDNTEESKGILDSIADFFKGLFGGSDSVEQSTENIESTESTENSVTFDSVEKTEDTEAETETEEDTEFHVLDYVNWDMQNGTETPSENNNGTPSFDDLAQ